MTISPQKITFGEMRESGVRDVLEQQKVMTGRHADLLKSKCPSSAIIPPTLPGAATGSAGRFRRSPAGA